MTDARCSDLLCLNVVLDVSVVSVLEWYGTIFSVGFGGLPGGPFRSSSVLLFRRGLELFQVARFWSSTVLLFQWGLEVIQVVRFGVVRYYFFDGD